MVKRFLAKKGLGLLGKKKKTQMVTHDIEFEQIEKAIVKISFNK